MVEIVGRDRVGDGMGRLGEQLVLTAVREQKVPKADVGFGRHEEGAEPRAGGGFNEGRKRELATGAGCQSINPN
jgi:hypothetical protein